MKHLLILTFSLFMLSIPAFCQYSDDKFHDKDIYNESCGHFQAILAMRDDGATFLKYFYSSPVTAANGINYYRWEHFKGDAAYELSDVPIWSVPYPKMTPMNIGYRFGDGKMYLYDFDKEEETMAYDFTLQPGDKFTTPEGTEWEVLSTEKREFKTLHRIDNRIDYLADHTVLSVRSTDGTKTDEWIEYLGAVRYPIVLKDYKGVKCAHVCFMSYCRKVHIPYLIIEFNDDPLYGCYRGYIGAPQEDWGGGKDEQSFVMNGNEITVDFCRQIYQTRYYFFAYRNDNDFAIQPVELAPYFAGVNDTQGQISFQNLPENPDGYNVTFNGKAVPTSIKEVKADQSPTLNTTNTYNLQGQKVGEDYKGIVIKNRRKELQK